MLTLNEHNANIMTKYGKPAGVKCNDCKDEMRSVDHQDGIVLCTNAKCDSFNIPERMRQEGRE